MSPAEVLDFLAKLGPVAREHGIDSVEFEDGPVPQLKAVKFSHPRQLVPVQLGAQQPKTRDDGPKEPRPSFAGRTPEEIRNALPNWGTD